MPQHTSIAAIAGVSAALTLPPCQSHGMSRPGHLQPDSGHPPPVPPLPVRPEKTLAPVMLAAADSLPAASKRTPAHPLPRQRKRLPHAGQPSDTSRLQTRGTRPDCRLRSCRRLRARRLTRTSHDTRTTTAIPTSASRTREALKCCSKPHRVALSHAGW